MGGFYGSVQVRTTAWAAVKSAAELVAKQRSIKCLIGPEINGWIAIYPEGNGQDHNFGHALAQQLPCDVLHLLVHDDDVLAYWLWRDGKSADSYCSNPGALSEENQQEGDNRRGDPDQFRPIIGDHAKRLAAILNRDEEYTFESERLAKLAKLLCIANAVTAYEYLEGGERAGIKGWRKFEAIPPKLHEPKLKRATAGTIRSKLRRAGVLLHAEDRKEFTVVGIGCVYDDGFLLGWSDFYHGEHHIGAHRSSWGNPQRSPVEFPSHLAEVSSDMNGNLSLIRTGQSMRVVDGRRTLREIPEVKNLRGAIVSPRRDVLAYAAAQNVVVVEVETGRQLHAFAARNPRVLAIHPTGKWIVASADSLRISCLKGNPHTSDVYVGGNSRLAIANVAGIEEPGCIGFSRDGRLFWCGTNVGLRIYEWESLANGTSRKARWLIKLHDQLPSFWQKQVTAIAEESDGSGIVFGTFAGNLARFDLHTGELFKLAAMPNGGCVETALFSVDGKALAVYSDHSTRNGPRSMPKHTRSWEILDYLKLRDAGIELGRGDKSNPLALTMDPS
jgi:WD40 repeat protein